MVIIIIIIIFIFIQISCRVLPDNNRKLTDNTTTTVTESVKPNSGDKSINLTFLLLFIGDTRSSKIFKYTFLIRTGRTSIRYTSDTPVFRFLIRNSHICGDSFMLKINRSSVLFLLISTGCCYRQNGSFQKKKDYIFA